FTDDVMHDPYAATRGLFFSHMGWIFRKPTYTKLTLIEKDDLDRDPSEQRNSFVRFQHKYYVPLALFTGLVMPTLIAATWGDAMGGYIWAGLFARVLGEQRINSSGLVDEWLNRRYSQSGISTRKFVQTPGKRYPFTTSDRLAHWEGLQPYTDEITARGNILFAMLTCGEGNHNFHAFPHDYRAGPNWLDWDPSKWIITVLQRLGLAYGLRRARKEDIKAAKAWIQSHHHEPYPSEATSEEENDSSHTSDDSLSLPKWSLDGLTKQAQSRGCLLVIDGYVVDVSSYIGEHPGGAVFLRRFAVPKENLQENEDWRSATWAFQGGMNVHSRIAKKRMASFRVAKLIEQENGH
ncbi:hypothetical protein FRC17_006192, partial [Serendipita sp. 399]